MRRARFTGFAMMVVGMAAAAGNGQPDVHFKPAEHVLGDVHPFFHEGECFLFYLRPGDFRSSLARSRDLIHWQEAEVTHAPVQPGEWMQNWFVLGIFRDPVSDLYRSFFGSRQGRAACSVSRDLVHWSGAPSEVCVPPGNYYVRRRDPFAFWIPETKRHGCVMTTWMKDGGPRETGGALSLAISPDPRQCTDHGAVIHPDVGVTPTHLTYGLPWDTIH